MNRSIIKMALILTIKPLGENNSTVTLLTDDNQIVYATLYGGPKSKLRSLVAQYNCGKIWLYENPEKNQIKISDFEVHNYHTSFGQNLFKIYAANLAVELVLKTKAAGSNEECYKYVCGFLDGMDLCNEEQSRLGLIRFLWRFIILLGVQPDLEECDQCGAKLINPKFEINKLSYYNSIDNSFVCSDCAGFAAAQEQSFQKNFYFPVSYLALSYLYGITNLSPSQARQIKINQEAYEQLRQIVFFLIEKNVGQKLNTIETGVGIL